MELKQISNLDTQIAQCYKPTKTFTLIKLNEKHAAASSVTQIIDMRPWQTYVSKISNFSPLL